MSRMYKVPSTKYGENAMATILAPLSTFYFLLNTANGVSL